MGLPVSSYRPTLCLPEDGDAKAASLLRLFPTTSDGCILLLDDTDLHFSSNFARHFDPSKIVATTSLSHTSIFQSNLEKFQIFWDLYHPFQTIISKKRKNPIPWNEVECVLWFPNFGSSSEHIEPQRVLLQNFFEYLAIRILADALNEVQVILTMNNIRFSHLEVIILCHIPLTNMKEQFSFVNVKSCSSEMLRTETSDGCDEMMRLCL